MENKQTNIKIYPKPENMPTLPLCLAVHVSSLQRPPCPKFEMSSTVASYQSGWTSRDFTYEINAAVLGVYWHITKCHIVQWWNKHISLSVQFRWFLLQDMHPYQCYNVVYVLRLHSLSILFYINWIITDIIVEYCYQFLTKWAFLLSCTKYGSLLFSGCEL